MSSIVVRLAILTVTVIAFARTGWVILGFMRTLLRSRSTIVASKWGWVELLTVPEPVVLAGSQPQTDNTKPVGCGIRYE